MKEAFDSIENVRGLLRKIHNCYKVPKLSDFSCKTATEPGSTDKKIVCINFSNTLLLLSDKLALLNGQWFSAKRLANDLIPALKELIVS